MMVSGDEVAAAWRAKWQKGEGERCADVHGEAVGKACTASGVGALAAAPRPWVGGAERLSLQSISPIIAETVVGGLALGDRRLALR